VAEIEKAKVTHRLRLEAAKAEKAAAAALTTRQASVQAAQAACATLLAK
jgi:hypothetical protein